MNGYMKYDSNPNPSGFVEDAYTNAENKLRGNELVVLVEDDLYPYQREVIDVLDHTETVFINPISVDGKTRELR